MLCISLKMCQLCEKFETGCAESVRGVLDKLCDEFHQSPVFPLPEYQEIVVSEMLYN